MTVQQAFVPTGYVVGASNQVSRVLPGVLPVVLMPTNSVIAAAGSTAGQ